MLRPLFSLFMILTIVVLTSCKDYYNDMIQWADSIKVGTDIKEVKQSQPDFVEVDWSQPAIIDTLANQTGYLIKSIKGNTDILKMENYLEFKNDKYIGRMAHK